MKIILKENIEGLGARGDVATVKDGYARNFLLPKGLAMRFTAGVRKVLDQEQRVYEVKQVKVREEAEAVAEKISELELSITKRAGDQEVLYGSVTPTDIAELLAHNGFSVDRRKLLLNEPIKRLGDYEIGIRLHQDVVPSLKLHVLREE